MNGVLMVKTARDHAALFLVTVGAVLLFEILFVLAMRSLAPELISFISRRIFLQTIFRAILSLDMQAGISVNTLLVLGLVHPFLFAVTWGFMTAICTRITVGEIDQGTADLLLTLPLSRSTVYVSTSLVWIVAAVFLSAAAWLGLWLGNLAFPLRTTINFARMAMGAVNLFTLYLAIGGIASLISASSSRRGVAIGILLGVLLFSYLSNFLASFVEFFRAIGFLGLLDYYRPVQSVRDGTWPVRNMLILSSVAIVTWTCGLLVFCRRDVPVA
jgi:ABC-type transport system involved in multi-copper enzyme maturation permease subunit